MIGTDLSPFFNTDEFAEEVTFKPADGGNYTLTAIYDAPHSFVDQGLGEERSSLPQLTLEEYGFLEIKQGDGFEVRAVDYYVRSVEPDGTGMLILQLSKDTD